MKAIKKIEDVREYFFINDSLLVVGRIESSTIVEPRIIRYKKEQKTHIIVLAHQIFVQEGRNSKTKVLDSELNKLAILEEGFNIRSGFVLGDDIYLPNKLTLSHWKISPLKPIEDLKYLLTFTYIIDEKLFHQNYKEAIVKQTTLKNTTLWERNVSGYGTYKTLLGQIKPNEIEYKILPCSGNILVPLKGGQLLALDAETGEDKWLWTRENRGGKYGSDEDYVYNTDGISLNKIDGQSGSSMERVVFDDVIQTFRFFSTGPVWVRGEYIILADVTSGEVVIFNKEDLSLFKQISTNISLPNSETPIQISGHQLFILGMDYVLRVYDLRENEYYGI